MLLWVVLSFLCGFGLDFAWVGCVASVNHKRPLRAANLSALIHVLTILPAFLLISDQAPAIAAYVAGGWAGTFLSTRWEDKSC